MNEFQPSRQYGEDLDRDNGIDGWTEGKHPWFYLSEKVGEMTAPLVGAASCWTWND